MSARRWPRYVYGHGDEPDYRFSFANERTFLAWIRTALAFVAAGVAVDVVDLSMSQQHQGWLAIALVFLGILCSVVAWVRWAMSERALRRADHLPSLGFAVLVTIGLVLGSLFLVAVGL